MFVSIVIPGLSDDAIMSNSVSYFADTKWTRINSDIERAITKYDRMIGGIPRIIDGVKITSSGNDSRDPTEQVHPQNHFYQGH